MLQQIGNARLGEAALKTLTSMQQNRQHCYSAETGKPSQELADSILKFYTAKYKLKCQINNIDSIRKAAMQYKQWNGLIEWVQNHQTTENKEKFAEFIKRVIFPFGERFERRWEPKTPEFEEEMQQDLVAEKERKSLAASESAEIPKEIVLHGKEQSECGDSDRKAPKVVNNNECDDSDRKAPNALNNNEGADSGTNNESSNSKQTPKDGKERKTANENNKENKKSAITSESSEDDHFSLDRLTCSACLNPTATDKNDLILCDGHGCFRAYHMQCIKPAVTFEQIEEEESWFCPWCSAVAEWMHEVQCHWNGEEWEQRRLERKYAESTKGNSDNEESESSSLKSWDDVPEVFPEADWEYRTSLQLSAGQNNSETKKLIAQVLGLDDDDDGLDEDEDNLEVDGNFDLNSYEKERQLEREELKKKQNTDEEDSDDDEDGDDDSNSSSTHSSQVTLVEMSSVVDLEIASDELNALSDVDDSEDDESLDSSENEESGAENDEDEDNDGDKKDENTANKDEEHNAGQNANEEGETSKNTKANCEEEDKEETSKPLRPSNRRRSRRLRKKKQSSSSVNSNDRLDDHDPGKMDEKNILYGKRKRTPVDYRKLNDALFGDWDAEELAKLEGGEDFEIKVSKKGLEKKRKKKKDAKKKSNSNGTKNKEKKKTKKTIHQDPGSPKRPRTATQLQKAKTNELASSPSKEPGPNVSPKSAKKLVTKSKKTSSKKPKNPPSKDKAKQSNSSTGKKRNRKSLENEAKTTTSSLHKKATKKFRTDSLYEERQKARRLGRIKAMADEAAKTK